MLFNKFKRIFLIEPNLKKPYGHVVVFPYSLRKFLISEHIETYVICNKGIDKNLLSKLPNTYSLVTKSCFENLNDGGATFSKDLKLIDQKFYLTENDLLIILTAYTNEIKGVKNYLREIQNKTWPIFALWFHQLFPPTEDFFETTKEIFIKDTYDNLREAFSRLLSNVFLFTTPSHKLQSEYSILSCKEVNTLPLPFDYSLRLEIFQTKTPLTQLTFGFLGDGRYEKGLLIILKFIVNRADDSNRFIIQDIFPRGFPSKEVEEYKLLKDKIRINFKNVSFINKPLEENEYRKLIQKIDVILAPYHPASYDKRVSGVFIEALIHGKPVISSKGTWMEEEINRLGCGCIFDYADKEVSFLQNFRKVIEFFNENYDTFRKNALKTSKIYIKIHSPKNFMESLVKVIKNKK